MVGLIVTLACGLFCASLVDTAQQPGKVVRVGLLSTVNPRSFYVAFEQHLRELGYVEGQNLATEFRTAAGHAERLPALAAELVRLQVDVIGTPGPEATLQAARQATSTIPIVMIAVNYDPMAQGYIESLARPSGNLTGVFFLPRELTAKRLELLKEALPQVTRVAALWDAHTADQWKATEAAAQSLGLQPPSVELRHPPYDCEGAIGVAVRERAQALVVLSSPLFFLQRAQIVELALTHRLPAIFILREYVEAGGLMATG
jgi:putative ABC transport system substrate-binding protein